MRQIGKRGSRPNKWRLGFICRPRLGAHAQVRVLARPSPQQLGGRVLDIDSPFVLLIGSGCKGARASRCQVTTFGNRVGARTPTTTSGAALNMAQQMSERGMLLMCKDNEMQRIISPRHQRHPSEIDCSA